MKRYHVRNDGTVHDISTPEKLVEFTKAMTKVMVDRIVDGTPIRVTKEEASARLNICKACPNYKDGVCKLCSCNMPFKVELTSMTCPEGKW
jgi:hypothetical protein